MKNLTGARLALFVLVAAAASVSTGSALHLFGASGSISPLLLVPPSTTVTKDFAFGPGTTFDHSEYRTLDVPPKTTVGVAVKLNTDGGVQVPVYIEVHPAQSRFDWSRWSIVGRETRSCSTESGHLH